MVRYRVLPYKQGSKSAKALADALGGKVLKLVGSKFKPKQSDVIINWGNTGQTPDCETFLNYPPIVKNASNKLYFFNAMKESCDDIIPRFWVNKEDIPEDAYPIVCRTQLAGHSGAGIVIADSPDQLVAAPLYVQYVKKKDEYRIHVGRDYGTDGSSVKVISLQRKARRLETPDEQVNWKVRNHSNGFVFVRSGINPPLSVLAASERALEASGLDFGAVDVIYNEHEERAYVLEINTAPGLEGQTVTDYVNFFKGVPNA